MIVCKCVSVYEGLACVLECAHIGVSPPTCMQVCCLETKNFKSASSVTPSGSNSSY